MNKYESQESIYLKIEELVDSGLKINVAIKKLGYELPYVRMRLSVGQWEDLEKVRKAYLLKIK